jgi:streptogramin lyase
MARGVLTAAIVLAGCVHTRETCEGADGCCGGDCLDACVPTTCIASGASCGMIPDGCGGTLDCGRCTTPLACGLLVGDANDGSVACFDPTTCDLVGGVVMPGTGGVATLQDVAIGPDQNIYVTSWSTGSIQRFDGASGAFIDTFVMPGSGGLANPDHLVFRSDGRLYVSDRFVGAILRYDAITGAFIDTFVSDPALSGFTGFAFGPDGNIYASEYNGTHCIRRYDGASGTSLGVFACDQAPISPTGVTFGPDGNVYVSGINSNDVVRYDGATGAFIDVFVQQAAGADYSAFGPNGNFYVCALNAGAVLEFTPAGAYVETCSLPPGGIPKGLVFTSNRTTI